MNRYRSYFDGDDGPLRDADVGFSGVIARGDARLMPAGSVRYARNISFELGAAATRGGWHTLPWAEEAGVDFPLQFTGTDDSFDFDKRVGFGPVLGSGVFDDPYGQEAALLAVRRGVYLVRANATPVFLRLPLGMTLEGRVRFVQTFEKVLMFRGADAEPLEWNPLQVFEEGYEPWLPISQTNDRNSELDNTFGDGTDQIPNAGDAVAFGNRLFVISGRDEIVVSDILDYTRFSRVRGRWTINQGTGSALTRLAPFNQTTLLAFKGSTIYLIGNVYGDLSEVRVDVLTTEYGCVAPDTVLAVGRDVYFLSEAGYFGVSQALDNKLQAVEEPVSAPIQPIIDRINWNAVGGAVAAYHENRIFLAVPLDGSVDNNAILVLNLLNKAWEGVWTADFLKVQNFVRLDRAGKRRLFVVNGGGQGALEAGALFLTGAGVEDNLYGVVHPVECELLSRGFAANEQGQKDFLRVIVDVQTWNPRLSVGTRSDGVNEEIALETDMERDRRRYMIHGKGFYDVTNEAGGHSDPWREDYSVELADGAGIYPRSGFDPVQFQRVQFPYSLNRRGEYCQVRVRNTRGMMRLNSLVIEARGGARSSQARK